MSELLEQRVEALERQLAELAFEVSGRALRQLAPEPVFPPAAEDAWRTSYPMSPLSEPVVRTPRRRFDLEELVGGRLLALVGGLAVVVGIAFFVALAINHGWIGEAARVSLAGGVSVALFVGGVWLYERKGRTQAALAVVGTAIAGMFLTLTAATAGYHVIPFPAALPMALGIGVVATAIAVRWDTRTVAGVGIGGTLAAPLFGNALTTSGMVFLAVASGSAAAVFVWRRWQWLAFGVSALTLGQLALWVLGEPGPTELVVMLSVFAALNLALALGYQVRAPATTLRPATTLLVPTGALVLAALGYFGLPHAAGDSGGGSWLVGLAVAHVAVAGVAHALRLTGADVTLMLLGVAVVLGDVAFGLLGGGWVLGVGWAVSSVGFAAAARRVPARAELGYLTLGIQLSLAVGHALLVDARPQLIETGGVPGPGALAAVVAVMVSSFVSARLIVAKQRVVRVALEGLTMASLAYATTLSLGGAVLLLAWAASCLALAGTAGRGDLGARVGSISFLGLVVGHVLVIEAPPSALVDGLDAVVPACVGLVLIAALAMLVARLDPDSEIPLELLRATAAVALLYLFSTVIIDVFRPGLGQFLLSVLWGACGIATLVVGLRRTDRFLRLGGLGLLSLAATKVFLYDLGALQSAYRVGSFIGLGLLLLGGAYAYQRLLEGARPGSSEAEPGRP